MLLILLAATIVLDSIILNEHNCCLKECICQYLCLIQLLKFYPYWHNNSLFFNFLEWLIPKTQLWCFWLCWSCQSSPYEKKTLTCLFPPLSHQHIITVSR